MIERADADATFVRSSLVARRVVPFELGATVAVCVAAVVKVVAR